MKAAMEAVRKGKGINRAALEHCVPRTTLKDGISGWVVSGTKSGPKPYLSPSEEEELRMFLTTSAEAGYGRTRRVVKVIVESVASDKGLLKESKTSNGWLRRFMERQPNLALRRGDSTSNVRMDAVNEETINMYYDLLYDCLQEHDLLDKHQPSYTIWTRLACRLITSLPTSLPRRDKKGTVQDVG